LTYLNKAKKLTGEVYFPGQLFSGFYHLFCLTYRHALRENKKFWKIFFPSGKVYNFGRFALITEKQRLEGTVLAEVKKEYITIKLRLHPTWEQAELIEKTFGCCRYLWNKMLEDAQDFYAATDLQFIPTPAHYKKEAPFLKEVDSQALCTVHQKLRKAFLDFFRAPDKFGYPQFKTKKAQKDSFTVYCREYRTGPSIRLTDTGVQMPKLGLVPANVYRKPLHWWSLISMTVSKSRSGKYFCSIVFDSTAKLPEPVTPTPETTVSLDFSPAHLYIDSMGSSPDLPDLTKSKGKLTRMQRKLACMEQGSANYQKQLQKIRLQYEHIANQRKDFIHKESRRIANTWDAVCVKELDLVELSRTKRNVMDLGFGMFRSCLQYKLERMGKTYIIQNQAQFCA